MRVRHQDTAPATAAPATAAVAPNGAPVESPGGWRGRARTARRGHGLARPQFLDAAGIGHRARWQVAHVEVTVGVNGDAAREGELPRPFAWTAPGASQVPAGV